MFEPPALSLSLAGLSAQPGGAWSSGPREAIRWAVRVGFAWVQPDAGGRGLRPRDLDRSARRDVAALLRRCGLSLSGLDLWIPPEHFNDPATCDRALAASLAAIDLLADLARLAEPGPGSGGQSAGGPVLSLTLPENPSPAVEAALRERGGEAGVRIADHAWPIQRVHDDDDSITHGVDPARILLGGSDPAALVARLGPSLGSVRLSDADSVARVTPLSASGRLDGLGFVAALSGAAYRRPVVLDLRGVATDPGLAAPAAHEAWARLAPG